jgi:hypothetical protein
MGSEPSGGRRWVQRDEVFLGLVVGAGFTGESGEDVVSAHQQPRAPSNIAIGTTPPEPLTRTDRRAGIEAIGG